MIIKKVSIDTASGAESQTQAQLRMTALHLLILSHTLELEYMYVFMMTFLNGIMIWEILHRFLHTLITKKFNLLIFRNSIILCSRMFFIRCKLYTNFEWNECLTLQRDTAPDAYRRWYCTASFWGTVSAYTTFNTTAIMAKAWRRAGKEANVDTKWKKEKFYYRCGLLWKQLLLQRVQRRVDAVLGKVR